MSPPLKRRRLGGKSDEGPRPSAEPISPLKRRRIGGKSDEGPSAEPISPPLDENVISRKFSDLAAGSTEFNIPTAQVVGTRPVTIAQSSRRGIPSVQKPKKSGPVPHPPNKVPRVLYHLAKKLKSEDDVNVFGHSHFLCSSLVRLRRRHNNRLHVTLRRLYADELVKQSWQIAAEVQLGLRAPYHYYFVGFHGAAQGDPDHEIKVGVPPTQAERKLGKTKLKTETFKVREYTGLGFLSSAPRRSLRTERVQLWGSLHPLFLENLVTWIVNGRGAVKRFEQTPTIVLDTCFGGQCFPAKRDIPMKADLKAVLEVGDECESP